jgi:flagellar FliL protein
MTRIRILSCILCISLLICAAPAFATADDEDDDGKKSNKPPPDFEYVVMQPLMLPIITEQGLTQQVSLQVSLEVPYGQTDEIKAMQPKLADAYINDLYGMLGAGGGMMQGSVIDVPAIKRHLSEDTDRVLGPNKVHSVLLQVVQQSKR